MKKCLLLIFSCSLLAACQKHSTSNRHCYLCSINDSVVSTIPVLSNPHTKDTTGLYCDLNQAQEQFMIVEKTYMDTSFYRPTGSDTLTRDYWSMSCQEYN